MQKKGKIYRFFHKKCMEQVKDQKKKKEYIYRKESGLRKLWNKIEPDKDEQDQSQKWLEAHGTGTWNVHEACGDEIFRKKMYENSQLEFMRISLKLNFDI